jgi:hypothetical protein
MRKYSNLLIILLFLSVSTPLYSGWDRKCLEDCFSTKHECSYCDYMCAVDDARPAYRQPTSEYVCPF